MRKQRLVFLLLILSLPSILLTAQDPFPYSPEQQEKYLKRWIWYQPSAIVALKNGDTLVGQPIHFNMEEFYLYPSDGLPLSLDEQLKVIPLAEIDSIWLNKGGRITVAQTSGIIIGIAAGTGLGALIGGPVGALIGGNILGVSGGLAGKAIHKSSTNEEIWLNPSSTDYLDDLMKLRTWSIFEDSVLYISDLEKLPDHSAAVRRAFPEKKLRISLGVNLGTKGILVNSLKDVLESSELPEWSESYGSFLGFEFLDFSWRINPHWIVGGGLMTDYEGLYSFYYYPPYSETGLNFDYSYGINLTDVRFYTEYVLNPVDRFFTTHGELLFGGGLIISLPISHYRYSEWDNGTDYYEDSYWSDRQAIFGLQLRGAYHLYLARNFSLSGGLEVNLYQNLKQPALEPPAGYAGEYFGFPDHTLNYSTIRFKFGAHLYF